MPVNINGKEFYRTAEACQMAGISKNTFLRWVRDGVFRDVELRDRKGWRLFSPRDLNRLESEVNRVAQQTNISRKDRE